MHHTCKNENIQRMPPTWIHGGAYYEARAAPGWVGEQEAWYNLELVHRFHWVIKVPRDLSLQTVDQDKLGLNWKYIYLMISQYDLCHVDQGRSILKRLVKRRYDLFIKKYKNNILYMAAHSAPLKWCHWSKWKRKFYYSRTCFTALMFSFQL